MPASWGVLSDTTGTEILLQKNKNARDNFTEEICKRLENTCIESTDANRVIRSRDTEKTSHFVDPPYIGTHLGYYSGYNEMHFTELLDTLKSVKGKFMLTMFPHEILKKAIQANGWYQLEISRKISTAKNKRRDQVELIVTNYPILT